MDKKRVFLIVLDSFGCGELPDAAAFGDEGSNTLRAVSSLPEFNCPNLTALGLFNIEGCGELGKAADIDICADTGPEVITGSTRMKAGTAQKIILNMISTAAMVKCGCVYENMMINLKPTNKKLTRRMVGIVTEILGCTAEKAEELLDKNGWNIRSAVGK